MLQRLNQQTFLNQDRSRPNLNSQNQTTSFSVQQYYQRPTKLQLQTNYCRSIKDLAIRDMPSFGDESSPQGFLIDNQRHESTHERNPYPLDHHQSGQVYSNIDGQGNYQYRNRKSQQHGSVGKCSKVRLDRVTEQRELNIDRINEKIKRIVDTLNQEKRKITENIDLKIPKDHKISTQSHNQIIKEDDQRNFDCKIKQLQRKSKQKEQQPDNIEIKEKFERFEKRSSQRRKQKNQVISLAVSQRQKRQKDISRVQDVRHLPQKNKNLAFESFPQNKKQVFEQTPQKKIEISVSRLQKSNKSCKLSNGKDLDSQIERIQKKIEDFQQMKKQLNLQEDFSTSKVKQKLNTSLSKSKQIKRQKEKKEISPKKGLNVPRSLEGIQKENLICKNKVSQFHQLSEQKMKKQPIRFPLQARMDSELNQKINLPKPFKMSERKSSKRSINIEMKKQVESAFIFEQELFKNEKAMKSLVLKICYQIDLDQTFRNSKKWFSRILGSFKWQELSQQLMKFNIQYQQHQLNQIFTITEDEENPFHTARDEDNSFRSLVENFLKSDQYWEQNIRCKYIRQDIQMGIKDMDIEKRNTVSVEDMVRYINLESDKQYRNRDLAILFKRLSHGRQEVEIEDVVQQLCLF